MYFIIHPILPREGDLLTRCVAGVPVPQLEICLSLNPPYIHTYIHTYPDKAVPALRLAFALIGMRFNTLHVAGVAGVPVPRLEICLSFNPTLHLINLTHMYPHRVLTGSPSLRGESNLIALPCDFVPPPNPTLSSLIARNADGPILLYERGETSKDDASRMETRRVLEIGVIDCDACTIIVRT